MSTKAANNPLLNPPQPPKQPGLEWSGTVPGTTKVTGPSDAELQAALPQLDKSPLGLALKAAIQPKPVTVQRQGNQLVPLSPAGHDPLNIQRAPKVPKQRIVMRNGQVAYGEGTADHDFYAFDPKSQAFAPDPLVAVHPHKPTRPEWPWTARAWPVGHHSGFTHTFITQPKPGQVEVRMPKSGSAINPLTPLQVGVATFSVAPASHSPHSSNMDPVNSVAPLSKSASAQPTVTVQRQGNQIVPQSPAGHTTKSSAMNPITFAHACFSKQAGILQKVDQWAQANPRLASALMSGGAGALTGGLLDGGRGAAMGGLLGGGLGAAAGPQLQSWIRQLMSNGPKTTPMKPKGLDTIQPGISAPQQPHSVTPGAPVSTLASADPRTPAGDFHPPGTPAPRPNDSINALLGLMKDNPNAVMQAAAGLDLSHFNN